MARRVELVRSGRMFFEFVNLHQGDFPVRAMDRMLGVSPSGYYAWLRRPPSARALHHQKFTTKIEEIWTDNREGYGMNRPGMAGDSIS